MSRIHRTELAVSNAVGPTASHYYKHLEKFLFKIPEDIIGLPIFQLIKIKDANIESTKIKDKKFLGKCFLKAEKISKGSLDLIPSPSVKIQIMSGKVCLRCEGKTLLGIVNKL